jgi:hypothetical protein
MALAYAVRRRGQAGDFQIRLVDITLDAAYAAGGYALSSQQMGLGSNGTVLAVIPIGARGGFFGDWNQTTGLLMIRDASGVAGAASPEVGNANAAINGVVVRCLVIGVGAG